MTIKPIIFSGPMVRAILDGRKTQTRRIVKIPAIMRNKVSIGPHESLIELDDGEFRRGICHYKSTSALSGPYSLPYAVGDLLWVREAWRAGRGYDGASIRDIRSASRIWWEADDANDNADAIGTVLRPSIHMPRWASRLTLRVTDVRVQRLHEISEADAQAEGCLEQVNAHCGPLVNCYGPECPTDPMRSCNIHGCWGIRKAFADLWNSLHGPDTWAQNPWVAAITFEAIQKNVDEVAR